MWAGARFLIVQWQGTGSPVVREMKDAISLLLWLHTPSKCNSSSFDSEYCFVFRLRATPYPGSLLSQSTVSSWVCCTPQYDAHSFGWCLTRTSLFECRNHVWLSFHGESYQAFDQQWQEEFYILKGSLKLKPKNVGPEQLSLWLYTCVYICV